jgi:hypothetical protein
MFSIEHIDVALICNKSSVRRMAFLVDLFLDVDHSYTTQFCPHLVFGLFVVGEAFTQYRTLYSTHLHPLLARKGNNVPAL